MFRDNARRLAMRSLIRRRMVSYQHPHAVSPLGMSNSVLRLTENVPSDGEIRRHFSERLLGYSPMSPAAPISSTPTKNEDGTLQRIPTAEQVSSSGGVWAPTSAKRDKLAELKIALEAEKESLDEAATPEQMEDLYLADGIQLIAKTSDSLPDTSTKEIQEFSEWLVEQQGKMADNVTEAEMVAHLSVVSEKISNMLSDLPASLYLKDTRDFFDPSEALAEELEKISQAELSCQDDAFEKAVLRFRFLLTRAAVEHLKSSWAVLTTVSDRDVDRAAVRGEAIEPQAKTVPLAKIYKLLFAHASGTCSERVDAAWQLLDRDNDGLIDEVELNNVAFLCVTPVQDALVTLFEEALDADSTPPATPENGEEGGEQEAPKSKGWRQRRKEAKTRKGISKLFLNASKNHFQDEVEINHRLRCVYAWAEKADQDNKLDSVVVESDAGGGWSGTKRHVELAPKISMPEFREVQQVHFTHLDRIGKEILASFREDIWVQQGKGRQNRELMRDCFGFLAVVSIVDYIIVAA